jgi:hypothetical protein
MQTTTTDRPSPDPKPSPARDRLVRGLRQIWELELIISGAVAFALLQLPSAVSAPPASAARQVLHCLVKIHHVLLDSRPLPGIQFQFAAHPKTSVRGIVAYIPTAGLSPGSHLLRVEAVPRPEPRKGERPPDPYLIRFWV